MYVTGSSWSSFRTPCPPGIPGSVEFRGPFSKFRPKSHPEVFCRTRDESLTFSAAALLSVVPPVTENKPDFNRVKGFRFPDAHKVPSKPRVAAGFANDTDVTTPDCFFFFHAAARIAPTLQSIKREVSQCLKGPRSKRSFQAF